MWIGKLLLRYLEMDTELAELLDVPKRSLSSSLACLCAQPGLGVAAPRGNEPIHISSITEPCKKGINRARDTYLMRTVLRRVT